MNHLFKNSGSERISECQSHMISVNEASVNGFSKCGCYLAPCDGYDRCLSCLGVKHTEVSFMDKSVELKFLSMKTLLLLALAAIKRVGDLHAFLVDDSCLEFGPADSQVILRLRPGNVHGILSTRHQRLPFHLIDSCTTQTVVSYWTAFPITHCTDPPTVIITCCTDHTAVPNHTLT